MAGAGVRLGGLWWKKGDKGDYLEGQFGLATIRIFINDRKPTDKSPDASMVVVEKPKPQQQQGQTRGYGSQQGRGSTQGPTPYRQAPPVKINQEGPPSEAPPWPSDEEEFPF